MGNNVFTLCSFFYSILLTITFFSKKRVGSYENKLYEKIVILNIISALFALLTYYSIMFSMNEIIVLICSKGLLFAYFLWMSQLTKYVYVIMHPIDKSKNVIKEFKQIRQVMHLCMSVFIVGIIVLPIDYSFDGLNIYTYGLSANITYIGAAIYWVLWMFFIIANRKKEFTKIYINDLYAIYSYSTKIKSNIIAYNIFRRICDNGNVLYNRESRFTNVKRIS